MVRRRRARIIPRIQPRLQAPETLHTELRDKTWGRLYLHLVLVGDAHAHRSDHRFEVVRTLVAAVATLCDDHGGPLLPLILLYRLSMAFFNSVGMPQLRRVKASKSATRRDQTRGMFALLISPLDILRGALHRVYMAPESLFPRIRTRGFAFFPSLRIILTYEYRELDCTGGTAEACSAWLNHP